jgi:N,N'-diacetyllegionaminate synthase
LSTVRVADRLIGSGQPCFLVAEVGINHNGDINLAIELVRAASKAGADGVKFQNYRTEDFVSDHSLTFKYVSQGKEIVEKQYDLFKRCELTLADLRKLRTLCAEMNLMFLSTPTSERGVKDLVDLGVPLLKNGSDFLQNLSLIQVLARTGLPTLISTGMATYAEIEQAVGTFREAGGKDLILLTCTSMYPTPPEDAHLRRIPTLGAAFSCPVGFSDHTEGYVAALGAVCLGACVVEKHFTLDKSMPGPDHWFSADPKEFALLVHNVRVLEKELGNPEIRPTAPEMELRRAFRISCIAARDMKAGHVLSGADIVLGRPGNGLPPAAKESLIGRSLRRDVSAGHPFETADFAEGGDVDAHA